MKQTAQIIVTLVWAFGLIASGCGETGFVAGNLTNPQTAPGTFEIPAKLDIVFAQDNSPSMIQALPEVESRFPELLQSLESSGWDYRLVTTPLGNARSVDQILASRYDSNWLSISSNAWIPPIPGADPSNPIYRVLESLFSTPDDYEGFIDSDDIDQSLAQYEDGFETIDRFISNKLPQTQFLRKDATLAVLVLGNGEDGSGVNFCSVEGFAGLLPCEYDPYCGPDSSDYSKCEKSRTGVSSYNQYRDRFQNLEESGKTAQVRFYSAVAYNRSTQESCLQSNSTRGDRYISMAYALNGRPFDLCKLSISRIFENLTQEFVALKDSYRVRYLVINDEPEVDTIQVVKLVNGDPNQKFLIPQDPENGWTYVGGPGTVYTIDYPVPLNEATGYIIELHGAGKLSGNDSAEIEFKPAGTQDASG